ncbi:hypothetical protein [Arthrobacter sp. R-11]|uniref:hypothetical protein n=1 Tax=Arthrobacter sp. R-11 TaxID=3404053 RepID=UPI003CF895AA
MLTSILRTVVPALWGSFIGWVIGLLPILEPLRPALLEYATPLTAIAGAVLIAAWYAFWRWLEPKLPAWLVRAVLGSAKTPVYPDRGVAGSLEAVWWQLPASGDNPPSTPSSKTPGPDHRA